MYTRLHMILLLAKQATYSTYILGIMLPLNHSLTFDL